LPEHVFTEWDFFSPFNSAGLLQRFHLLVFFLPTGKWEFPGLTSLNPRDIQSQILEAAKILILASLPVGFLPDAHKSCFQSQLFQPGKKKKPLKEQRWFSHHFAATTVQRPGTQPSAGARLAAGRGESKAQQTRPEALSSTLIC